MFALFFNLYYSMFVGSWSGLGLIDINNLTKESVNKIGELITSIFGDSSVKDLGDSIMNLTNGYYNFYCIIALVLATITSIGIVVMAVKGIKRVFGVFFMGIR